MELARGCGPLFDFIKFQVANIDNPGQTSETGEKVKHREIRPVCCELERHFRVILVSHNRLSGDFANGNASPGSGALHHNDELVDLFVLRDDGLKRRQLFLQRVHLALQLDLALLIDAESLDFSLERLELSVRGIYVGALMRQRRKRNIHSGKDQNYREHEKD